MGWPSAHPNAIVQCPFKLKGRRVDGECRRNRRDTDINQRPAGTATCARTEWSKLRKRDRAHGRRDTEVELASCLSLATYANVGKSIYLYLFIAFKCFPRNGAEPRADVVGCRRGPPAKESRSRSLRATRSVGSKIAPLLSD